MEDRIKKVRSIILDISIIALIVYLVIATYTYLKTDIPYYLYFIKTSMQIILGILGITLILLYISKLKMIACSLYNLFKKTYFSIKSFSLGQKFILVAVILLIYSVVSLIKNNENYANTISILSYYFLALGVLSEFVNYILAERLIK
ncbi:conserved hypothetical protein [Methanocaldococcus sp. FS406-22]|uniref:hypothetical protein n=1 Tax=Methanocaldococcus sp. (strain FS406-22) TaxID=644281 RepID=UPI0001BF3ED3|nr:hypothetical protein [Methanocaldococcus sp. FS406-22]ADC69296.1 conserved hypothetical protein [Methanocaldococcus sp. FS406-22]